MLLWLDVLLAGENEVLIVVRMTCEIQQFQKSKTLKFHHNFDENKLQLCEHLINVLDGISMENQGVRFENELRNPTLIWKDSYLP